MRPSTTCTLEPPLLLRRLFLEVANGGFGPGCRGILGAPRHPVRRMAWELDVLATNCVIVTPAGLICRNNLCSKPVSWPEIESFTVGPGRGRMRWPALIIRLNEGSRVITNVTSFTATYPALVARALTALQADAAATAGTSQDTTAREPD